MGSIIQSVSTALVPRELQVDPSDLERIPIFSVQDDLLGTARRTKPDGLPGPNMRSAEPIRSHDGRVATGIWDCEAGVFEVNFTCDEVVHILEGQVHVTSNDMVQTLEPGDVAFFRKGLSTTWVVPHYVRKIWFHHNPKPTLKQRVARKLRAWREQLIATAAIEGG
jgi:uncharacterized cupin superfamily protein